MSRDQKAEVDRITKIIEAVSKGVVDLVLYNGMMNATPIDTLIQNMSQRKRRENVLLILTTYGGDPDAAYALARALQRYYKRFTAYVPGYCTSAGTLVLLGAHELILSAHAQLGPLDIQVQHADEIGERRSGLAPTEALRVLETRAREAYRKSFEDLRFKLRMPTRLAAETASRFVAGLYRGSFSHVDPIRLGEMDRANRIAFQYGERLVRGGQNVKDGTLVKLVADYPSHEFVIDITEARELFSAVREPTTEEAALDTVVAWRKPIDSEPMAFFIDIDDPADNLEPKNGPQEPNGSPNGGGEPQDGPDRSTQSSARATSVRKRGGGAASSKPAS